jgi:RHS repeat-associated protein
MNTHHILYKIICRLLIVTLLASMQPSHYTKAGSLANEIIADEIQLKSPLKTINSVHNDPINIVSQQLQSNGILDTFDRVNGPIGNQWVGDTSNYTIDTNTMRGDGSALYWNTAFSANQEVSIVLSTIDTNASEINILLKAQDHTACNVIMLFYDAGSEAAQVWTCHDAGVWLQHGSDIPISLQTGDRFGAQITSDGSLGIYHNEVLVETIVVSSSWPFLANRGKIGLWLINPGTTAIDDFAGGSLPTTITPTLQISGSPTTGSIEITSLERFRLVFDAAHAWQPGIWNDLTSDPAINLSRNDLSTLNYNVIQSPLELYDGSWNTLSTVLTPTIEVITQTTSLIELHTQWFWQTANNNLFSVRTEHVIHANGLWDVATAVTNVGSSSVTFGNGTHGLRYAFTNPCPIYSWTEELAVNNNSFSHTRDDGAEPYPRILVTRDEPLGSFGTDGDLNRYWELSNAITLAPNASWSTSWTNQIWFGPSTPPVDPPVSNASLELTPPSAGPNVQGTQQRMQATLLTQHSEPITNTEVLFTITGANPGILSAITDIDGTATITYTGSYTGTDSIVATADVENTTVTSNLASIGWVVPLQPITTSTIWGQFFTTTHTGGSFTATPSLTPLFTQSFPTINFNPPAGRIPNNTSGIGPSSPGFTNITTHLDGSYSGKIVAQGNGYIPNSSPYSFNAVFTGEFLVAAAGEITFNFYHDDGFILGIGNGATRVSGVSINPPSSGRTAFLDLPVMGANNQRTSPSGSSITVYFPAPGTYPYEVDYAQGPPSQAVLTMTTVDSGNLGIPPSGSLSLSPVHGSTPFQRLTGQSHTIDIQAVNAAGEPVANLPITLLVTGANQQQLQATTSITGFVSLQYQGANVGTDTLEALAWFTGNAIYSNQINVAWQHGANAGSNAPLSIPGQIASPTNLSTVTGQIPITLATGLPAQTCTVDYWPADDNTATNTLASNITAGSGITLATLDTTLLANGSYVIRTACTNSTGTLVQSGVMVTVSGDYKPGRVRFEVTDLTIPLSGLPITVGRVYDSLERQRSGDFGYGWSLSLGSPRLEVDLANNVTLTQPNGQRVTFYFTPASYGGVFGFLQKPTYTPEAGVYGTLTANGCAIVVPSGGRHLCFLDTASYQPTTYTYTDPYGRVFVMSADGSLQSITDLQQNKLTFSDDGITSSAGGRSVAFNRDSQNRITEVVDPAGNSYSYSYDSQGDLIAVGYPGLTTPTNYEYDTDHLITEIIDARGNSAALASYDTDGRLISETDAVGNTTTYSYTLTTRTTIITHPDGGNLIVTYNPDGTISTKQGSGVHTIIYTYDANRNIIEETDALSQTTTFNYDRNGHLISRTDPLGRLTSMELNQYGGMLKFIDPEGNSLTIRENSQFMPIEFVDEQGLLGSTTWNAQGNLLSRTDTLGRITHFTYDSYGNKLSETNPLSETKRFTYDLLGRQLSISDSLNRTTNYTYDSLGRILEVSDPLGQITRYTYDANGNQLSITDPVGRVTNYTYDPANRLTNITYADTTTEEFTYDFRDNILTEMDRAGYITRRTYNTRGELIQTIYAEGTADEQVLKYEYDVIGRTIRDINALDHATQYTYDAASQLISITDPLSHTTTYSYTINGQRNIITDANGRRTQLFYDERNRPTSTLYPDGSTTTQVYDGAGQLLSQIDELNRETKYTYDDVGRLLTVTNPLSQTTIYTYDNIGNLASVTDANGNVTQFSYDALDRLAQKIWPDSSYEAYTYDLVGNLVEHRLTDGAVNTFSYDLMDRLIEANYFDGQNITYTYTSMGLRDTATDSRGTTEYVYDNVNRLQRITQPNGQEVEYNYDAVGNRIRMTTPAGTSTYTYDSANQLTSVTDPQLNTTTFTYNAVGLRTQRNLPNGITTNYSYDLRDRPIYIADMKNVQTLTAHTYTYDLAGNKNQVIEQDGNIVAWEYDIANRLIGERWTNPTTNTTVETLYTYDAVGNRLSQDLDGITTTYTYNTLNQLITAGDAQYNYDGRGNLTHLIDVTNAITYTYDAQDRLISAIVGGIGLQNTYDVDGRRVQQITNGITTNYLWDIESLYGDVVLETDEIGAIQASYVFGNAELIAQRRDGTTSYYLHDGQGSVRALVDDSGSVTDIYRYTAFGEQQQHNGTTINPYRYTGQHFDIFTGLYNLRARYYNPTDGRFLSRDLAKLNTFDPVEWNRYNYARMNPIMYTDPTGWSGTAAGTLNPTQGSIGGGTIGQYALMMMKAIGTTAAITALGEATLCNYSLVSSVFFALVKDSARLLLLDNIVPPRCVIPIVRFPGLPQIQTHIFLAQYTGTWSPKIFSWIPPQPMLLTYRGPAPTSSGHARPACKPNPFARAPVGFNSCDEYPFASTIQGGGLGVSIMGVDRGQNSAQGGRLGAFYTGANRQGLIFVRGNIFAALSI